jgi:hypothetical protein
MLIAPILLPLIAIEYSYQDTRAPSLSLIHSQPLRRPCLW